MKKYFRYLGLNSCPSKNSHQPSSKTTPFSKKTCREPNHPLNGRKILWLTLPTLLQVLLRGIMKKKPLLEHDSVLSIKKEMCGLFK